MDYLTIFLILLVVLLLVMVGVMYNLGKRQGMYKKQIEWQENLVKIREDIAGRQRSAIKGRITEAFAPFLEGFPFKASECKFIGDPIDYIAFEGLDERDVKSINFVEVKTDKSSLSRHQKQIKEIIDSLNSGKVQFREFKFFS